MSFLISWDTYYPLRVLQDINIFKVRSSTQVEYRLLALQRVAAAALGAYLFIRYQPVLQAQFAHTSKVDLRPMLYAVGLCIASPSTLLASGMMILCRGAIRVLSGVEHRKTADLAYGLLSVLAGHLMCQFYKQRPQPNLLISNFIDELFIKIAHKNRDWVWKFFFQPRLERKR